LYKDSLSRLEEYLFSRSGRHQYLLEDIMAKRQRKRSKKMKPLHVIQPNAAGIDIGATEIYVAVPDEMGDKKMFLKPENPRPRKKRRRFLRNTHTLPVFWPWHIICKG
jgi:hypothetical protein